MRNKILAVIFMMMTLLSMSCGSNHQAKVYEITQEEDYDESTDEQTDSGDSTSSNDRESVSIGETADYPQEIESEIYVQICGAVNAPGVYKVPSSSRVFEAVEIAGGVTDDAQTDVVNLTKHVYDEMIIYIPTKDEVENNEYTMFDEKRNTEENINSSEGSADTLININTADKDILMTLPGVGESKALAIISYRQENGSFQTIEDIMKVTGIKEAAFEKIKDKITV